MIIRNYEMPQPIVNNVGGTIEDVAGSLTTTQTLMTDLIGNIENMQVIARQQKEHPGSISPEAVNGHLDGLWALGEAINQRICDNVAILHAVVKKTDDSRDIERASTVIPSSLLRAYQAASTELARCSAQTDPAPSDAQIDALGEKASNALWQYAAEYPASLADMTTKFEIFRMEGVLVDTRAIEIIGRDLSFLAGLASQH